MPSRMPQPFSNGVVVERDDPEAVDRAVLELVRRLKADHPEIIRMIWFGSRVQGKAHVGSDVDLCLVLSEGEGRWFDRIPRYQPLDFPTDIDIFPYTEEELELLASNQPDFHGAIMAGREL